MSTECVFVKEQDYIRCVNCNTILHTENVKIRRICGQNISSETKIYSEKEVKQPKLKTKIINFAKAIKRFVKQPGFVDINIYEKRLTICTSCEFMNKSNNTCGKCGCALKGAILNKAKWITEKCPIDKW